MADAAESWNALLKLKDMSPEFRSLRVDALNNMGHLHFHGLGVVQNKGLSIKLWTEAVSLGHTESEFHLCRALADGDDSNYDPNRALRHCAKAEAIYSTYEEDEEILQYIRNVLGSLEGDA